MICLDLIGTSVDGCFHGRRERRAGSRLGETWPKICGNVIYNMEKYLKTGLVNNLMRERRIYGEPQTRAARLLFTSKSEVLKPSLHLQSQQPP